MSATRTNPNGGNSFFFIRSNFNDGPTYGEFTPETDTVPDDDENQGATRCSTPVENKRDALVRAFAAIIQNFNLLNEHGAILVNSPNGAQLLRIVEGTPNTVPQGELLNTIPNAGYDYSQVIGFVHYHPPSTASTLIDRTINDSRNRAPYPSDFLFAGSSTHDGSLRSMAEIYLNPIELNYWASNFSQYLVGPDLVPREFDGITSPDNLLDNVFDDNEAQEAEDDASSKCEEEN